MALLAPADMTESNEGEGSAHRTLTLRKAGRVTRFLVSGREQIFRPEKSGRGTPGVYRLFRTPESVRNSVDCLKDRSFLGGFERGEKT